MLSVDQCTLDVRRSLFASSNATNGAAILATRSSLVLLACRFQDLRASIVGGAIQIGEASYPVIRDCTFERCWATFGGAIGIRDSFTDNEISGCLFHECRALPMRIYNANPRAVPQGGALFLQSAATTLVTGSNFTSCHANQGQGGAVATFGNSRLAVEDSVFVACTADNGGSGGAIYHYADGSLLTLDRLLFARCIATAGAALFADAPVQATQCVFRLNWSPAGEGHGAGVFASTLSGGSFTSCVFADNQANLAGGGLYVASASQQLRVFNCSFVR